MSVKRAAGIIFANMHDSLMGEFTLNRSMASLPFGGRYRLIDFCLSSLVDANVTRVGVVAKSNYHSLMDHIGNGKEWDLARKNDGLSILPPHRGNQETEAVYHGRIQALYNVLYYIKGSNAKYIVMMDCDHVANIDLKAVLGSHEATGADVTALCYDAEPCEAMLKSCVMFKRDKNGKATDMMINRFEKGFVFSMNVFIVGRDALVAYIEEAMSKMLVNFERDVLLANIKTLNIQCYMHEGYVRRIFDLKSYYDANMSLLDSSNLSALFLRERPVYTKVRDEAPVRYGLNASIKNCLAADGCIIEGSAENCVLFRGVTIEAGANVKNSIIMQGSVISEGARLDHIISDKVVRVSESRELLGTDTYPLFIRKGSVV